MSNDTNESLVWIELPKPASNEEGHKLARLANNMLSRLSGGDMTDAHKGGGFQWSETKQKYIMRQGFGSKILADNGEWFNLDYLGRAASEAA